MADLTFNEIPSTTRNPGVYFELNTKDANSTIPVNTQKVLLLAQMTTSGTASANVPIQIFNTSEAETYFGRGSIAHIAAKGAIKANKNITLYVCPVSDLETGSTTAVRTITFSGAATASGKISIAIDGKYFTLNYSSTVTIEDLIEDFTTLFSAYDYLPYTPTSTVTTSVLTAKNAGSLASDVPISIDLSEASGISAVLSETTDGAGDPDLTDVLAAVSSVRYQIVCSTFNDDANLLLIKTWIKEQSEALSKKAGRVHYSNSPSSTIAEAITKSGNLNSGRVTAWFFRGALSSSYAIAAAFAALDAGETDPNRPLQTLEASGIVVPTDSTKLFDDGEIEALLWGGVATIQVDATGQIATVGRWITTYTQTSTGIEDPTLLDGTVLKALDYVRDAILSRLGTKFPRDKRSARVKRAIRAEVIDVLYDLEDPDVEILQNVDDYLEKLEIGDFGTDGITIKVPSDVIPGLHIIAGTIDLIIS